MASTSYTTLPSSSYVGLGSQGDLFHAANYGAYDTGIGSLTSHPYQYQTTNLGTYLNDTQQQPSYSNDYLPSTYSNGGYSTQKPQYYSTDRYAQQLTHNEDPPFNDYTNSQTQKYNNDGSYAAATVNTTQPPQKTPMDNHRIESNNQHQTSYTDTTQHHPPVSTDNQRRQSQSPPQTNPVRSEQNTSNHSSSQPKQQQRHQSQPPSQSNHVRSEQRNSKLPPPAAHRSPSNGGNDPPSATTAKTNNPPPEMKTTKSTKMRAAAIKQKEESREQKKKDGNFPSIKKKSNSPKSQQPVQQLPSEDEQNNTKKQSKRNKKQSHSLPKQHKSRHDDYPTEDNNSSDDEDDHDQHTRRKSKKRTAFSDPYPDKDLPLPPVRRGRRPPLYEPPYDYPYPPGHSIRGRYPYYDDYPPYGAYPYPGRYDYRHRHLYDDDYDAPPYVAPYRDPYDESSDYEKRKPKSKTKSKKKKDKKESIIDHEDPNGITGNETEHEDDTKSQQSKKSKNRKHINKDDENDNEDDTKSQQSKKNKNHKHINKDDENDNEENIHPRRPHNYYDVPYYDDRDMLEVWRQERNDYLKKKFKPSIHDVLYAQQWIKSDSYLENQRRRALRDAQGYYFPYKKYTLKDYKDLQKNESQNNPYASINEITLDRKERAKKRQEYAAQMERHIVETSGTQQKTPRDLPLRRPWHLSHGEPPGSDKPSKRERALEYAKIQVVKNRPKKAPKNRSGELDPTEQYVNSLFPQSNNDGDGSANEQDNQSSDDDGR